MKVSEAWLREWVNPDLSVEKLAAQLTMAGLEVDSINPVAGVFSNIVVAEVLKTQPHPQADKLTLCEINANDEESYKVVCGAANVRPGIKVALAKLGATMPGGMKIKKVKLRGELSQGMLCSASELGLEERSEGIMELPENAPIGQDIRQYMALDDNVLDIDLTPNRADCFSIKGIAREVAALNDLKLSEPTPPAIKPELDETVAISISASTACPQYYGRLIRGINPDAESPLWLKERLRRGGIRPLHPVVDVTNYVMLELGQPMHAFDYAKLDDSIEVRFAHEGDTLTLLDGQEVTLADNVLVIADKTKTLAMAGVMGGEDSAVAASTTDVFLESAYFNPLNIAGVARRFGLCTDSSQRFERGVDPALQKVAIERATELLLELVGGQAGPVSSFIAQAKLPQNNTVVFHPKRVKQLSGVQLSEEVMKTILENLGMQVTCFEGVWDVEIPSHRFDIAIEEDLVEEIIRLNGYDNIEAQPMVMVTKAGSYNPYEQATSKAASFLTSRGYHETISYSFVDPVLQKMIYPQEKALALLNPISQELSEMRLGLWPGLVASMIRNLHRQHNTMKLFETGVVFGYAGSLEEVPVIAGLVYGEKNTLNWSAPSCSLDFFDVKGDLQALFAGLNRTDIQFEAAQHPALHPGKSAAIYIGQSKIGWIGALHPKITDEFELTSEALLFELKVEALIQTDSVRYQPISKYPQIRRDLSLLADLSVTAEQIKQTVRDAVQTSWLKGFDVFDVYAGKNIPEGKKSIAIALTLQDDNRTLVDDEINVAIDAIIKTLNNKLAITLRD